MGTKVFKRRNNLRVWMGLLTVLIALAVASQLLMVQWCLVLSNFSPLWDDGSAHSSYPKPQQRPNGVFVLKTATAEHAAMTLCSLTHFFNGKHGYPVRIFVDQPSVSESTQETLQSLAGEAVDLQIIPDPDQRWRKLPSHLTPSTQQAIIQQCKDWGGSSPICTSMKVPLGYVYMNYWNYGVMPFEPELQQFDYIVSFDADAFLTKPMGLDPFQIMHDNDLIGIFDIEAYQFGDIARGIQETTESLFTLEERSNRFLGSRQWFDGNGVWNSKDSTYQPSVWTHFWGGRRDFFHQPRYREFAHHMAKFTYLYRVDEQPVIGAAWALLGTRDRIWYLPEKGIQLGVYHHGWVDNREMLRPLNATETPNHYQVNTLHHWHNFHEHHGQHLTWKEYLIASGFGDGWYMCGNATTK